MIDRIIPPLVVAFTLTQATVQAEVPFLSADELKSDSSHIVVGKVQAVYSTSEERKNWQETSSVAEIMVSAVEKGHDINVGDTVYAHYWNKKWIGDGEPEPHSGGHRSVSKGEVVRAHLELKNGTYEVLLPNGFVSVKPDEETANATADKAAADDLAAIQGKWVRTVETNRGTFQILKVHNGNTTTLTITDSNGRVIEEKKSEFRLERTDNVHIFTFFNNAFTAGPSKGRSDNAPQSYIYRVTNDSFIEVRGIMIGDNSPLSAFTWKRLKE
ncbi:hypothetical protein AB1L42_22225 [Thalassoglobus sp. JC818]|uniref:hypothetical protein n=1 Tax=Thalassoglobus sp. JC818 TaxID=3232136 RepID=UPI0034587BA6